MSDSRLSSRLLRERLLEDGAPRPGRRRRITMSQIQSDGSGPVIRVDTEGGETANARAISDEQKLAQLFEANRSKLLAMVQRRLSLRLAARIDPEGILHDAFLRARKRSSGAPQPPEELT